MFACSQSLEFRRPIATDTVWRYRIVQWKRSYRDRTVFNTKNHFCLKSLSVNKKFAKQNLNRTRRSHYSIFNFYVVGRRSHTDFVCIFMTPVHSLHWVDIFLFFTFCPNKIIRLDYSPRASVQRFCFFVRHFWRSNRLMRQQNEKKKRNLHTRTRFKRRWRIRKPKCTTHCTSAIAVAYNVFSSRLRIARSQRQCHRPTHRISETVNISRFLALQNACPYASTVFY